MQDINSLEWSVFGGECGSGQIDLRPLFDVLGGWMLVLAETFLCELEL